MKVLHVITALSPRAGGPTTVLRALAKHQIESGLDVTVCTTNADHPRGILDVETNKPINEDGVKTFYFSVDFRPLVVSRSLRTWALRSLHDFDILHIHSLYRFPPTYCAHLARKMHIPYIIRPHGSLDPYLYSKSAGDLRLKRMYEYFFDMPNLHGAGAIHYTAEEERRLASFLHLRAPSFVVPNGIDWAHFDTLPQRGAFRNAHGIGDAPLVLFLGRLHHKKGLDILVPAFHRIHNACPEARLAIVGPSNDDYAQQVHAWVRERGLESSVIFVEFLTGRDLVQAYVDADVFVLPSYTENFGMTVVEAMAAGLPVIISKHVNIHPDITADETGLVTECDSDQVADAIFALLTDPERRHHLGMNGRRAARQRYGWPSIVERLNIEYASVIENSDGQPRAQLSSTRTTL